MFNTSALHPVAQQVVALAKEHGSRTCLENVALWAELACEFGQAEEALADAYQAVNERRLARGLPAIDFGGPTHDN